MRSPGSTSKTRCGQQRTARMVASQPSDNEPQLHRLESYSHGVGFGGEKSSKGGFKALRVCWSRRPCRACAAGELGIVDRLDMGPRGVAGGMRASFSRRRARISEEASSVAGRAGRGSTGQKTLPREHSRSGPTLNKHDFFGKCVRVASFGFASFCGSTGSCGSLQAARTFNVNRWKSAESVSGV